MWRIEGNVHGHGGVQRSVELEATMFDPTKRAVEMALRGEPGSPPRPQTAHGESLGAFFFQDSPSERPRSSPPAPTEP